MHHDLGQLPARRFLPLAAICAPRGRGGCSTFTTPTSATWAGQDAVSQAEASIMRRAATITTELERLEAKFASGESTPTDLDLYQRSAGNLRRLLESVGLQRRAKPVQSLAEYLASRTIEAEAEAEDDEPEADEVAQ
jgi:hypothetical protein